MLNLKIAKKILTLFLFINLLFVFIPVETFAQTVTQQQAIKNNECLLKQWGWTSRCAGEAIAGAAKDATVSALTDYIGPLVKWLITSLFWLLNIILENILLIVGYFVDLILYHTVLKYKSWTDLLGSGKDSAIYQIWAFIRDFLNTAVFFIIMYHSIRSMIEGFDEIKNKFIYLMVFALLVNFSLAFVKGVIDVSNIVTLTIYQSAVPNTTNQTLGSLSSSASDISSLSNNEPQTFTGYIVKQLNPAERWKKTNGERVLSAEEQTINNNEKAIMDSTMYQIGYFIALGYLIYLFLLIGSTFLVRAVAFIAAMILSPLLVAKFFYTSKDKSSRLGSVAERVKYTLFDYSLRGPAYMLVALLSATLAKAMFASGGNTFGNTGMDLNAIQTSILALKEIFLPVVNAQAATAAPGLIQTEMQMFMRFIVFIAFFEMLKRLFDSIIDELSHGQAYLGKTATSWAGKIGRYGVRAGGIAGSATFGNLGRAITDSRSIGGTLRNMQTSNNAATRLIARTAARAGDRLAKGTYDAANFGALKTGLSKLGYDLGEGNKLNARTTGKYVTDAITDRQFKRDKSKADLVEATGKGFRKVDENDVSNSFLNRSFAKINSESKSLGASIGKYLSSDSEFKEGMKKINNEEKFASFDDALKSKISSFDSEKTNNLKTAASDNKGFDGMSPADTKIAHSYAEAVESLKNSRIQAHAETKALKERKKELDEIARKIKDKKAEDFSKDEKSEIAKKINSYEDSKQSSAREKRIKISEDRSGDLTIKAPGYVAGRAFGVRYTDARKAAKDGVVKINSDKFKADGEKAFNKTLQADYMEKSLDFDIRLLEPFKNAILDENPVLKRNILESKEEIEFNKKRANNKSLPETERIQARIDFEREKAELEKLEDQAYGEFINKLKSEMEKLESVRNTITKEVIGKPDAQEKFSKYAETFVAAQSALFSKMKQEMRVNKPEAYLKMLDNDKFIKFSESFNSYSNPDKIKTIYPKAAKEAAKTHAAAEHKADKPAPAKKDDGHH